MPLLLFIVAVAPMSPDELLAKIREAQSWHDNVRMSVHAVIDERLTQRVFEYNFKYNHNEPETSWAGSETVAHPGEKPFLYCHEIYEVRTPLVRAYADRQNDNPGASGFVWRHQSPQPVLSIVSEAGSAMWGYHDGMQDKHICDVLAEAESLSIAYEDINGESCPVISADTKHGHIEVAVSPQKGYHPVEYRINTKGDQQLGGRSAQSQGVEWDMVQTFSEFTRIGEFWVPTKYAGRSKIIWLSGKAPVTSTEEIKLSDIELNPVFDNKTFTLGIMPDGTNLTDVDFGIEYFLKDGKLDPYVDHYTKVQELHDEIAGLAEPARPTDAATQSPDTAPPQTTTLASPATRFRLLAAAISTFAIVSLAAAFTVKWRIKRERKDGPPPNG